MVINVKEVWKERGAGLPFVGLLTNVKETLCASCSALSRTVNRVSRYRIPLCIAVLRPPLN